jgi:hypothetical protein
MNSVASNLGGLVTTLFIALKLAGAFPWSWYWVLSPIWIVFLTLVGKGYLFQLIDSISHLIRARTGQGPEDRAGPSPSA